MKINTIYYSSYFAGHYKNLPPEAKYRANLLLQEFKKNCFSEQNKVYHLSKFLSGYWGLKVTESHSILFEFLKNSNDIGFIDISDNTLYHD